jgi:hypothetical protein
MKENTMKKWMLVFVIVLSLILPGCVLAPTIVVFDVVPGTITAGQQATLTWSVSGVPSVTIDYIGTVPATGAQTVMPATTTAYTLRATNFGTTVSKSVVLTVNPQPVIINFEINPATISSGGYATLIWNVTGASSVSIDQGIGQVPPAGNKLINPTVSTNYTLTATNAGVTSNKSATLVVNPPIVASFTTNPGTTFPGQGSTLQWTVSGATTVSIDNGIGEVPANGSRVVNPFTTTVYTLSASSDCCSVSKSVTVTVGRAYPTPYPPAYGPFIEIFTVNPPLIHPTQSAVISWYVAGADSVYISNIGYVSNSGSVTVSPTITTSYTLQARNAYFITQRNITLQVSP